MLPEAVIEIRQSLCSACDFKDPCASCEHGLWGRYEDTGCDKQESDKVGLGDMVASVAQPIAKALDHVFGTDIQNCGGCKQRQEKLNDLFP